MKSPKYLALTALIAAASLATGHAQSSPKVIYITGATAFRALANTAIDYLATNNTQNPPGRRIAFDTNSITKAYHAVWQLGGANTNTYISAYWVGSEAGIQSVTGPSSIGFATNLVKSTNTQASTTNPFVGLGGVVTHSGTGSGEVWTQVVTMTNLVTNQIPNTLEFWNPLVIGGLGSVPVATNSSAPGSVTNATATIGVVDTYQQSSAFSAGAKVAYYSTNGYQSNGVISTNLTALATNAYQSAQSDTIVAAGGYGIFTVPGAPVYNITLTQLKKLATNGYINAYEVTSRLADTNAGIYFTGRNIDSGARANVLALIGLGSTLKVSGVNNAVKQYAVLNPGQSLPYSDGTLYRSNSSSSTNSLVVPWPAEVIDGKLSGSGNGGYSSGSTLVSALLSTTNITNSIPNSINTNLAGTSYLIGYSGAAEVYSGHGQFLSIGGVPFDVETIKSGAYPLWSFVHVLLAPAADGTASAVASSLASQIKSYTTTQLNSGLSPISYGTIALSDVTNNVTRTANVDEGTIKIQWTNTTPITSLVGY